MFQFNNTTKVFIVVILLVIVFKDQIKAHVAPKHKQVEKMRDGGKEDGEKEDEEVADVSEEPTGYEKLNSAPVDYEQKISTGVAGCDGLQFASTHLLPKDDVNVDETFNDFSPAKLEGQNFLDSRKFTIGTQSQCLRNANLQLRSEPANPTADVCAWNQTTIKYDERRPVE
jgi:hypothetical protein